MSDEEYYKKLASLQKYVPFLNYMINHLKDPSKKNRDDQLNKMQSLHSMITDKRKRLKLETLSKCEDVIVKLYAKVNHKSAPRIESPPREKTPPQTPASPSPPREIHSTKPVVIPTEKVSNAIEQKSTSSKSVFERLGYTERHHIPKVDIYSSAATTLNTKPTEKGSVFSRLGTKIPDMSKPPISIEDLKTLEEDEQDKLRNSSLQELNSMKELLEKQLAQEENTEKTNDKSINTTKRNQTVPVNVKPIPTQTTSKTKDKDSIETQSVQSKLPEKPLVKPFSVKSIHNKPSKVIKEPDSIFGNVLSSIDDKLRETKKKDKKDDRRNSMTDDDKLKDKKVEQKNSKYDKNGYKDQKKSHDVRNGQVVNKERKETLKEVTTVDLTKTDKEISKDDDDVRIVSYVEGKQGNNKNDAPVYQRLAHKYNPKPRKTSIETTETNKSQHTVPVTLPEKINSHDITINLLSPSYSDSSNVSNKSVEIILNNTPYNTNDSMLNNKMYNQSTYHTQNFEHQNATYSGPPMMVPAPVYNPVNQFNVRPQFVPPTSQFCPPPQTSHGFQQPNNSLRFEAPHSNHVNFNQNANRFTPNFGNNTPIMTQPMVSPSTEFVNNPSPMNNSINQMNNNTTQMNNEYFMAQERDNRMAWNRNERDPRIKRDPRNYREYREMKEKECNEPRDAWDNVKDVHSPNEFSKDPRCNRDVGRDRNLKEIERDPRIREKWNRSRSRDRRFNNRFGKSRSRSRSRPGTSYTNDSFVSPLDKLYNGNKQQGSKGYGMHNFRIPKIRKEEIDTPKPLNDDEPDLIVIEEDTDPVGPNQVFNENDEFAEENQAGTDEVSTKTNHTEPEKTEIVQGEKKIEEAKQKEVSEQPKTSPEKMPEPCSDTVKEVPPSEAKSQPSQPETKQDAACEESTINEKNILLKFFANLLGTQNKDKKKGALLSIISTFSESIGEKQIQRITNIIEHGDKSSDEEEDDEEEKEEKSEKIEKESKKKNEKEEEVSLPKKKQTKKIKQDNKEKTPKTLPKKGKQTSTPSKCKTKQKDEEEVVESIGERIKNRKKKALSPPKKKHRSELDMLHEDIQEMFIRDGVLTATGKRMCRMLKNDPNALSSSTDNTKRRKPGPKCKTKLMDDIEMKNMSSVRVILSKMPDELVKDDQRRLLRSSTKKTTNDYNEESDKESEKEIADENSGKESTEKEKKILKRKRKSSWATGTIKKPKKKKSADDVSDSESELMEDINDRAYIEPDKNYFATSTKVSCKLCSFSGRFISSHYRLKHSDYEVLNSRLSPEAAEEAIKDSEKNLERYEKEREGRTRVSEFCCRVCGFTTRREQHIFYDHITIHTGEFRYYCNKCNFICGNKKSLTNHCAVNAGHQGKIHTIQASLRNFIFGYICSECNYFQLNEMNVQEHIKIYHLGDTKVIKINMSSAPVEVIPKKDKKRKIENVAEINSVNKEPEENDLETPELTVGSKKRAAKEKAEEKMKLQRQIEDDPEGKSSKYNKSSVKDEDEETSSNVSTSSKKDQATKQIEKNVFTCETDLLEDNETIENERLQKMQELNKSVGSRSSLNFVDQLSNRLLNEKSEEEVTVKEEKLDLDETVVAGEPDDKKLMKFSPKSEMSSPILSTHLKKPVLETPYTSPRVAVPQKNNRFISGLLQKLKGVLESDNSQDKDDEKPKNPPPLFHLNDVKYNPVDANILTFDAGLIKAIKNNDVITFSCLVSPCAFSTTDKDIFQIHCREMHNEVLLITCKVCNENINEAPVFENLFLHLINNHNEFFQISSPLAIRTRKLSGDMLSLKDDLLNELPDLTEADISIICDDKKEEKNEEESEETQQSEEVSMINLQMDDDNPFPFRITGVMSLAEPQPPPLTPIQLKLQTIGVSSETKMTAAELNKVRKTQAALQKLLERMNELYKCPHFSCPYSTEYKDMFDIHIKSHQDDPNVMIPCVYCDMKTTVRHIRRHIELRHAHCRYACAYCLYRAYLSEYVVCHQNSMHPLREVCVKTVPIGISTSDVNIAAASERVPNPQSVCTKMVCKQPCGKEFLYVNDFQHHLTNDHQSADILYCGYDRCNYSYPPSVMASHWMSFHSVCTLQCAYCKFSANEMKFMQQHFANHHQNVGPYIYIRQGHIGLGYCADAFKLMRQVANFQPISVLKSSTTVKPILKLKAISPPSVSVSASVSPKSKTTITDPAPPPLLTLNPKPTSIDKKIVEKIVEEMALSEEPLIEINACVNTNDVDPLNLDSEMDTSHELDVSTNDDDLNQSKKENVKDGLKGGNLYRCICGFSGSNSLCLKKHLISSPSCKRNDSKPYECVHCGRMTRNPQSLIEHIQYHGILRFSCSLCNTKSPSVIQIRGHMKCRHNITKVTYTPLNPGKKNLESDEFVVRPKLTIAPESQKEAPVIEQTSSHSLQQSYTPDQIDKIPIRSIFSTPVKCGVCQYSTKVRTNLVRHLQFHSQEIYVPDTAPVNPVPCLDKNEKMFDKMTNLAISSFTGTGRMGSKIEKVDKVESEKLPEFVPIHCRYVCCAEDCNYLCPEEANLRHHLIALHDESTKFTCAHCKMNLGPTDADTLIKHFKLHGLHLYKCGNCSFLHHLRHKVERHFNDNHANSPLKIITVRALEAEPSIDDPTPRTPSIQIMQKSQKPWRCCMCKARSNTKEDIENHVLVKHEIDSQYKCALCTFKSNDIERFDGHFKEAHPDKTIDIISAYCKTDEGKKTDSPNNFDTTPLWLRDKPRVRHIRGILFEESSPQPKNVKKTTKFVVTSVQPAISEVVPSTSSKHLDSAIDAVAKGTADILKIEKENTETPEDYNDIFTMIEKELSSTNLSDVVRRKKEDVIVIDDEEMEEGTIEDMLTTHFDYEDEKMSVKSLIDRFGSLGSPISSAFRCPLCTSFQTERIIQFIHHVFKDLNYKRFACKLCPETTITSNSIITHLYTKHLRENAPKYDIVVNHFIEIWLRMVIYHQSRIILKNNPRIDERKSGGALECKICRKRFLQYTDLTRHKHVHWSRKPFSCVKCDYETFWVKDLESHCKTQHGSFKKIDFTKNSLTVKDLLNETIKKSSKLFNKLKSSALLTGNDLLDGNSSISSISLSEPSTSRNESRDESMDVDIQSLDEPEQSPTILIRSEIIDTEIDPNRFYFCLVCAYIANTKQEVKDHCSAIHNIHENRFKEVYVNNLETLGCYYCKFVGDELKLRRHHNLVHPNRVFKPIKYVCALCRKRSIRISNLKSHFKYIHPNANFAYKEITESDDLPLIVEPEAGPSRIYKEKLFTCTLCKYTTQSGKSANMKVHFQSHFLAYMCGNCGRTFKGIQFAKKHHQAEHPNEAESVIVDQKMVNDCVTGLKAIIASAKIVSEENKKVTARKSTGKPSVMNKEFSFYGSKPEENDLRNIIATVDINQEEDEEKSRVQDDFDANVGLLSPTDFSDVEDTFALENIVPSLDSLFSSVPEPFNF